MNEFLLLLLQMPIEALGSDKTSCSSFLEERMRGAALQWGAALYP